MPRLSLALYFLLRWVVLCWIVSSDLIFYLRLCRILRDSFLFAIRLLRLTRSNCFDRLLSRCLLYCFSSTRPWIAQDLQQGVNAELQWTVLQHSIDLSRPTVATTAAKLAISVHAILEQLRLHVVLTSQLGKELLDLLVLKVGQERALLSFQGGQPVMD